MAFVRCRKSLSMVKRCLVSPSSGNSLPFLYRNSTVTSFPSPNLSSFVSKLMQQPLSNVKATLDSEDKFSSSSVFQSQDFSWDALVFALKSSYPEKANLVVEWRLEKFMKENEKNHDSYSGLISLCGAIQDVETALRVFSSMEAQGLKPNSSVFNALISACLSSLNFSTALSLFELMESSEYKSNADTYNAFISAYANLGNKNAMQAWYLAKMTAGLPSDFQTYESLILGCVKSKDFCYAENIFEEMTLTGFIPNSSILQNMLVVYSQKRNVSKIKEYLKYAMDGSWSISEDTLVNVVGLFNELGGVKDMEELLVTLTRSNQPSDILSLVHSEIIRMYARENRLDDVEFSVGRMLREGISFMCSEDVEKVISLYFRHAAYDRLELFLKSIRDSHKFTGSTYDLLAAGYRRAGLQENLDLLKNDMKLDGFVMS